jgi:predicted RNA-binding protein with PUA-like domain
MRWMIKSEPDAYSFDKLVKEKRTAWTGIRNYTARNNLSAMQVGDECLFYHSVGPKEIVGIAKVVKLAYPDPTAPKKEAAKKWVAVDVSPVAKLAKPVTLAQVKAHPLLSGMQLVKQSRLSVCPVTDDEWAAVLELARG